MKDITSKQLFCAYIDRNRQEGKRTSLTEDDVKDVASLIISEINEKRESSFISSGINAFEIDKQIGNRLVCLKISSDEVFNDESTLKIEELCRWLDLIYEYYISNGNFTGNPYIRFLNSGREQYKMKRLPGQNECKDLLLKLDRLIGRLFSAKENEECQKKNDCAKDVSVQVPADNTENHGEQNDCNPHQIPNESVAEEAAEEISEAVLDTENNQSADTEDNGAFEIVVEEDESGSVNVTFVEADNCADDVIENHEIAIEESVNKESKNEEAPQNAESIIKEAEEKAKKILEEAQIQAENTVNEAENAGKKIIEDAQDNANKILEDAKEIFKIAEKSEETYIADYKSAVAEKKEQVSSFVIADRVDVKNAVVDTRASMDEVKATLSGAQEMFKSVESVLSAISSTVNTTVNGLTGALNQVASDVEYKNTEHALNQFSQIYDQLSATYNAYRYGNSDNVLPKFDVLNRLEMFMEIVELCLEDYALVAFETPVGEKYDTKKHKARVKGNDYDPRNSYIARSVKKGFMWGDIVKIKEEVEISAYPNAVLTDNESNQQQDGENVTKKVDITFLD